jgi:biotin transport system substrate-specific component
MERNLTQIALFAALIAALGLIPKFNLPLGVPITGQSLGIMLAGTVLGAKRGALAVILFLGLVALGLPLLAGGRGGLGVFSGVTAGFLFGWVIAAYVTGLLAEAWAGKGNWISPAIAAAIGGILVLYPIGIVGMYLKLDASLMGLTKSMYAFIPGDLIKCVLAGLITNGLRKARPGMVAG